MCYRYLPYWKLKLKKFEALIVWFNSSWIFIFLVYVILWRTGLYTRERMSEKSWYESEYKLVTADALCEPRLWGHCWCAAWCSRSPVWMAVLRSFGSRWETLHHSRVHSPPPSYRHTPIFFLHDLLTESPTRISVNIFITRDLLIRSF